MSLQGKKREYSNCVREKLEYLSLEESLEFGMINIYMYFDEINKQND